MLWDPHPKPEMLSLLAGQAAGPLIQKSWLRVLGDRLPACQALSYAIKAQYSKEFLLIHHPMLLLTHLIPSYSMLRQGQGLALLTLSCACR